MNGLPSSRPPQSDSTGAVGQEKDLSHSSNGLASALPGFITRLISPRKKYKTDANVSFDGQVEGEKVPNGSFVAAPAMNGSSGAATEAEDVEMTESEAFSRALADADGDLSARRPMIQVGGGAAKKHRPSAASKNETALSPSAVKTGINAAKELEQEKQERQRLERMTMKDINRDFKKNGWQIEKKGYIRKAELIDMYLERWRAEHVAANESEADLSTEESSSEEPGDFLHVLKPGEFIDGSKETEDAGKGRSEKEREGALDVEDREKKDEVDRDVKDGKEEVEEEGEEEEEEEEEKEKEDEMQSESESEVQGDSEGDVSMAEQRNQTSAPVSSSQKKKEGPIRKSVASAVSSTPKSSSPQRSSQSEADHDTSLKVVERSTERELVITIDSRNSERTSTVDSGKKRKAEIPLQILSDDDQDEFDEEERSLLLTSPLARHAQNRHTGPQSAHRTRSVLRSSSIDESGLPVVQSTSELGSHSVKVTEVKNLVVEEQVAKADESSSEEDSAAVEGSNNRKYLEDQTSIFEKASRPVAEESPTQQKAVEKREKEHNELGEQVSISASRRAPVPRSQKVGVKDDDEQMRDDFPVEKKTEQGRQEKGSAKSSDATGGEVRKARLNRAADAKKEEEEEDEEVKRRIAVMTKVARGEHLSAEEWKIASMAFRHSAPSLGKSQSPGEKVRAKKRASSKEPDVEPDNQDAESKQGSSQQGDSTAHKNSISGDERSVEGPASKGEERSGGVSGGSRVVVPTPVRPADSVGKFKSPFEASPSRLSGSRAVAGDLSSQTSASPATKTTVEVLRVLTGKRGGKTPTTARRTIGSAEKPMFDLEKEDSADAPSAFGTPGAVFVSGTGTPSSSLTSADRPREGENSSLRVVRPSPARPLPTRHALMSSPYSTSPLSHGLPAPSSASSAALRHRVIEDYDRRLMSDQRPGRPPSAYEWQYENEVSLAERGGRAEWRGDRTDIGPDYREGWPSSRFDRSTYRSAMATPLSARLPPKRPLHAISSAYQPRYGRYDMEYDNDMRMGRQGYHSAGRPRKPSYDYSEDDEWYGRSESRSQQRPMKRPRQASRIEETGAEDAGTFKFGVGEQQQQQLPTFALGRSSTTSSSRLSARRSRPRPSRLLAARRTSDAGASGSSSAVAQRILETLGSMSTPLQEERRRPRPSPLLSLAKRSELGMGGPRPIDGKPPPSATVSHIPDTLLRSTLDNNIPTPSATEARPRQGSEDVSSSAFKFGATPSTSSNSEPSKGEAASASSKGFNFTAPPPSPAIPLPSRTQDEKDVRGRSTPSFLFTPPGKSSRKSQDSDEVSERQGADDTKEKKFYVAGASADVRKSSHGRFSFTDPVPVVEVDVAEMVRVFKDDMGPKFFFTPPKVAAAGKASFLGTGSSLSLSDSSSQKGGTADSTSASRPFSFMDQPSTGEPSKTTFKFDLSKFGSTENGKDKQGSGGAGVFQKERETSAPPPSAGDLSFLCKRAPGEWKCDTCLVWNKPEHKTECASCETKRPNAPPSSSDQSLSKETNNAKDDAADQKSSESGGFSSLAFLCKRDPGEWKCSACLVWNKKESSKCVSCETPNPDAGSQNTQAGGASSSAAEEKASSSAPKFSFGAAASSSASSSSPTPTFTFGSSSGSSSASDKNISSADSSAAVPKFTFGAPGSQSKDASADQNEPSSAPAAAPDSTGFSFGTATSSAASSTAKGSSDLKGFSFGAPTTKADSESKTTGFSFSAPTSSSSSTPALFTFGGASSAKEAAPAEPEANEKKVEENKAPLFSFGTGAADSKPTFSFGDGASTGKRAPDADKEGGERESQQKKKRGRAEGGDETSTAQTSTSLSSAPSFVFGAGASSASASTTSSGPTFSFGASNSTASTPSTSTDTSKATSSAPLFSFGASAGGASTSNSAKPSTAVSTATSSSTSDSATSGSVPSFVFGQSSGASSTPSSTFSFGSSQSGSAADAPASTFVFGSSSGAGGASSATTKSSTASSSAPAFSFGAPSNPASSAPSSAAAAAVSGSGPTFTFGSAPSASGTSSSTPSTNSSGFVFGAPSSSTPSTGSGPAMAFGQSATPASSSAFTFGQSNGQPPSGTGSSGAPAFTFGGGGGSSGSGVGGKRSFGSTGGSMDMGMDTAASGGFGAAKPQASFGGQSSMTFGQPQPQSQAPPQSQPSGMFQFGAPAQPQQPQQQQPQPAIQGGFGGFGGAGGGMGQAAAPAPAFGFGGASAGMGQPTPGMAAAPAFGAAPAPAGGFSLGTTSQKTGQRRRVVRAKRPGGRK